MIKLYTIHNYVTENSQSHGGTEHDFLYLGILSPVTKLLTVFYTIMIQQTLIESGKLN